VQPIYFRAKRRIWQFKPASIMGESDSDSRADLIYEVSGKPDALNVALALAGITPAW
jgi:hypothetical protein